MNLGLRTMLRLALGLFFAVSGAMKGIDAQAFVGAIGAFQLLPDPFLPLAAFAVVTGELFFGTLLMFGIGTRPAGASLIAALVLFTAVIISVLIRGMDVSCGCFGAASGDVIGPWTILRNTLLIILLCVIIIQPDGTRR
jgi:uncharacterized membrane protein YphA (DoxX/SURF4 family)